MRKKTVIAFFITSLIFAVISCGPASSSFGNLQVSVAAPDGSSVSGAKVVSNYQPDGQLKVTGITGQDGEVTCDDIQAGEYGFHISSTYEQKDFTVNVAGGKTTYITVTLTPR